MRGTHKEVKGERLGGCTWLGPVFQKCTCVWIAAVKSSAASAAAGTDPWASNSVFSLQPKGSRTGKARSHGSGVTTLKQPKSMPLVYT